VRREFKKSRIQEGEDLGYGKTQELEQRLEDVSRLLMAYANVIVDHSESP
jgi:hypothetical protein